MLLVLDRCDVIIVEMIIIVCCGGILGIYRVNSHKRDLLLSIIRVRYKKKKSESLQTEGRHFRSMICKLSDV